MTVTEAVQTAILDPELREVAADLLRLEAGVSLTVAQISRVTGRSASTVRRRLSDEGVTPVTGTGSRAEYDPRDVRRLWGGR